MRNPIGDKIEDFKLLDRIGSGGFAEVFKARCLCLGYEDSYVAIKRINKDFILKKKCEERIKNEIRIHSELSHPAIVKFHTSFEDEEFWYLVLELCERGSLEEFIKYKRQLSEEEACPLIKQVINGVQYLQLKQVIHRDLSLRNILLTEDGKVKIADFGLAVKCRPNEKKTSVLGTANFMSPEVVSRGPYDFKADIWSVGCVLYALLYGAPPFDGKKRSSIMNGVVKSVLVFPSCASIEATELLKDMLEKDPRDRIEIKNALQYAFFQKYEKINRKYERYSQKSGDSGMSSQSGSSTSSSRSSRKTKGSSDKRVKKHYETNTYSDNQQHERYFDDEENRVFRNREDNNMKMIKHRALSPCILNLKPSVPGSVNQLKNKIPPLPSRQDFYDSRHSNSETREFKNTERQTWRVKNGRNGEGENYSHDDRFESQFEVPVRSRPQTPTYPPHLQYLNEDNLNINSYYSSYNGNSSSKNYENIHHQNNHIIKANSEDNIAKYSSCSHDHYCPPENNCLHKSSCHCHYYPVPIHKDKNNSCHSHHSQHSYDDNKMDSALKNSDVNRSTKINLTLLTTVRLQPKRHTTKNAIVSILNDGKVCVEFLKEKKNYIAHVCFISQDGKNITIYKPKKKILPSDKPPPVPGNHKEVQYFSFENLPKAHWKKYQYAKLFVDIVRAKTPKVTLYGKDAKCVMMENSPNPDYEVNFFDGFQITEVGDKITIFDPNGLKITEENRQHINTEYLMDVFKNMKEKCKKVEACLEACSGLGSSCFPVICGRRPSAILRNIDDSKENTTPRSIHSSTFNGTISAMKSYSGSVNADYSPGSNLSPVMTSSPLNHGKKIESLSKNPLDVPPALKSHPLVVKGWVIAEYTDNIQMWISMSADQEVFFLDEAKQRLSGDHPELMKRVHRDLSRVLLSALSEEVKKTK